MGKRVMSVLMGVKCSYNAFALRASRISTGQALAAGFPSSAKM
jgi:hypothetical protein